MTDETVLTRKSNEDAHVSIKIDEEGNLVVDGLGPEIVKALEDWTGQCREVAAHRERQRCIEVVRKFSSFPASMAVVRTALEQAISNA